MELRLVKNMETLEDDISRRGNVWIIALAALRSRYFLVSMLFYGILLLLIGGYRISTHKNPRALFVRPPEFLVTPQPLPSPPEEQTSLEIETKEIKVASPPNVSAGTVRLPIAGPSAFHGPVQAPNVAPDINPALTRIASPLFERITAAEIERLKRVWDVQKGWKVRGSGPRTQAEFTVYKAMYQDGDWNCNPADLQNMLLQIRAWSRGRLKANMTPEALNVGTDEIFAIKPPFIYLTGHKDFHFLDREVQNLREYLMLGGCIWADSALAGRRSRFDIAFRREMKRVMPDRDFEIVPMDHEMFDTFFRKISPPSGMNFYQEPAEMIDIGGELAVLYTLNGHGHFWETRLSSGDRIEWNQIPMRNLDGTIIYADAAKTRPTWRNVYGPHLAHPRSITGMLYRNIGDRTVCDNYKFGINVVVHLLTRYQDKFRFLPLETGSEDAYTTRGARFPEDAAGL